MRPTKNKPTKAASKPHTATDKADKTKDTIEAASEAQKAGEAAPVSRFDKRRLRRDPETRQLVYRLDDGSPLVFPPNVSEEDVRAAFEAGGPLMLPTAERVSASIQEALRSFRRGVARLQACGLVGPRPEQPDGVKAIGMTHPRGTMIVKDYRHEREAEKRARRPLAGWSKPLPVKEWAEVFGCSWHTMRQWLGEWQEEGDARQVGKQWMVALDVVPESDRQKVEPASVRQKPERHREA